MSTISNESGNFGDIENVVIQFYGGLCNSPNVQKYLDDFQNSENSLLYIWSLLNINKSFQVQYFAASTLYKFVRNHWRNLKDEDKLIIRTNVYDFLAHNSVKYEKVSQRILMSLANIVLETINNSWKESINDITSFTIDVENNKLGMKQTTILDLLKYIPEEFRTLKKSLYDKGILCHELEKNVKYVLKYLNHRLMEAINNDCPIINNIIRCLNSWMDFGECGMDLSQNMQMINLIVDKLFPYIIDPRYGGVVIEFITTLVTLPNLYKYPEFVKQLLGKLMSLEPIIAGPDSSYASGGTPLINEIKFLVCTTVQVHANLLVTVLVADDREEKSALGDVVERLLTCVLACTDSKGTFPRDETISPASMEVWVALWDEIEHAGLLPTQRISPSAPSPQSNEGISDDEILRQRIYATFSEPLYARILKVMLRKVRYPNNYDEWNLEDKESFQNFRSGDVCEGTLLAIRGVIGSHNVLNLLLVAFLEFDNCTSEETIAQYRLLDLEAILFCSLSMGDNFFRSPSLVRTNLSGNDTLTTQTQIFKIILKYMAFIPNFCAESCIGNSWYRNDVLTTSLKFIAKFSQNFGSLDEPNVITSLLEVVKLGVQNSLTMEASFGALNAIFNNYAIDIDPILAQQIYQLCQMFHQSYYSQPGITDEDNTFDQILSSHTSHVLAKIFLEILPETSSQQLIEFLQISFAPIVDRLASGPPSTLGDTSLWYVVKMLRVARSFLRALIEGMALVNNPKVDESVPQENTDLHYFDEHPVHKQVLVSFLSHLIPSVLSCLELLPLEEGNSPDQETSAHVLEFSKSALEILSDLVQIFPSRSIADMSTLASFVPEICKRLAEVIFLRQPLTLSQAGIYDLAKDYVVTFCKSSTPISPQHTEFQDYIQSQLVDRMIDNAHARLDSIRGDQVSESSGRLVLTEKLASYLSALVQKVPHTLLPPTMPFSTETSARIERMQRIFIFAVSALDYHEPGPVKASIYLLTRLLSQRANVGTCFDFITQQIPSFNGPLGLTLTHKLLTIMIPPKHSTTNNPPYIEATHNACCELIIVLNKFWASEFKSWLDTQIRVTFSGMENSECNQLKTIMLKERTSWRRLSDQVGYFKKYTHPEDFL